MLGPLLFTLYVPPIADITQQHKVGNIFYADDTQLYVSISPRDINNYSPSLATLNSCLSAIKTWMRNNMLKLNDGKTELLLLCSPYFIKKNQEITKIIVVGYSYIESAILVLSLTNICQWMYLFTKNVLLFKGNLESCTEFVYI